MLGMTPDASLVYSNVVDRCCEFAGGPVTVRENARDFDMKVFANSVVMRTFPFPFLHDAVEKPPFVVSLDQALARLVASRKLLLPDLRLHTKTVLVFSDYGGEAADSRYLTYSFLFTSHDAHEPVLAALKRVRQEYDLNDPFKEICFTDVQYGPIKRSLTKWLNTTDYAVGLLFTLIVDKSVVSLFGQSGRQTQRELASILDQEGLGNWPPAIAEKMIRVVHVIGYWLAALTVAEQNVCWMTDHDCIVANPERLQATQRVFSNIVGSYQLRTGKVCMALPFKKGIETFGFSDFLSVPDLVAGSIESLFTRTDKMEEPKVREQANDILLWLCRQGVGLKKLTMSIKQAEDGRVLASITHFARKDGCQVGELVPIHL
jgi:hypothetical protein